MATDIKGRINSRPNAQKNLGSDTTGLRRTGVDTDRDGFLYVPESFDPKKRTALIVMLHDAGEDAQASVDRIRGWADRTGTILLAPETQDETWDALQGGFGADSYFIDEALGDVFALYPIDPSRVAIGGIGDGATYALLLAHKNADLFTHSLAFSPRSLPLDELRGMPSVFLSHGTSDDSAPDATGGRGLAKRLQDAGVDVDFHEFNGGRTIPEEIKNQAFSWFLGTQGPANKSKAAISIDQARNNRT